MTTTRSRTARTVAAGFALALGGAAILTGCGNGDGGGEAATATATTTTAGATEGSPTSPTGGQAASEAVDIRYEVDGEGTSTSLTYTGENYGTSTESGAPLPWNTQVTIDTPEKWLTLTATNGGGDTPITCRVIANGHTISEQTSSGPYANATCVVDAAGH
ncbi:MmpS family transport accessory protein [Rhodococcus rhodnii]|uniref:MmpS family membrane protein n=1 Tax=Rhodococcus rhodnii LMG 5362 TaxID=1273125 RepID=R7WJF7_9NOCA|nr:MmpS family transport accessory protein [Rhodococcus rhodnii]EOM75418.1 hypothetical protein Rrhod_3216 [Rhodococcus rhodnii LMG 5362]